MTCPNPNAKLPFTSYHRFGSNEVNDWALSEVNILDQLLPKLLALIFDYFFTDTHLVDHI